MSCKTQFCIAGEVSAVKNGALFASSQPGKSCCRTLDLKYSSCSAGMPVGLSAVFSIKGVAAGATRTIWRCAGGTVAGHIADDLAAGEGMANERDIVQIELFQDGRQIIRQGVGIVSLAGRLEHPWPRRS